MAEGVTAHYKYIVVGCGGIGSGTVYWLSKRAGKDVLGLEQFNLGHDNGGSQDHSRIIRLMYNDTRYTKLTPETFKAWAEVEAESGIQLVYKSGCLRIGEMGTPEVQIYQDAMRKNGISFETLDSAALSRRFPQFTVPANIGAVYEPEGGLVDAAMANSVHIQLARANGATVIDNCPVTRVITLQNGELQVHTTKGIFQCEKLIVTAGGWINQVLGSFGAHIPVTVTQEQVTYFSTPHVKDFTKNKFPAWIFYSNKDGVDYYGMPSHGNSYSKIGIDAGGPPVTVNTRTYTPDPVREKKCADLFKQYIPKAVGPIAYSKTCLYTMTRDRNFVVDTLRSKGLPQVIVCCGAGHAFKFASLLGKILSEMAVDGRTRYDISGFPIDRPAVTDPTFKPDYYMGSRI